MTQPQTVKGITAKRKPLKISSSKAKNQEIQDSLKRAASGAALTRAIRKKATWSLLEIFNLLTQGLIVLPSFQRDGSWKIEDRCKLLNFMLSGTSYLSPIAVNRLVPQTLIGEYAEIDEERTPIDSDSFLARVKSELLNGNHIYSLIDGLQRLTTLLMCREDHDDIATVFYDLHSGRFVIKKSPRPHHVHVHELFMPDDVAFRNMKLDFLKSVADPTTSVAYDMSFDRIRHDMLNYEFVALETSGLSLVQEVSWFIQLNDSGVNLSTVQKNVAPLAAHGFKFLRYIKSFGDILRGASFHNLLVKTSAQVSIPATAFTVPTEILETQGVVANHALNYSPIPSDNKSAKWAKDVELADSAIELEAKVEKAEMIAEINVMALEVAVEFWDALLPKTTLVQTHRVTAPERFRLEHIMYAHGFIMWKAAAPFLRKMNGEEGATLSKADFVLSHSDSQRLEDWMKGNSFHNKDNDAKRRMFKDLIS